MRTYQDRKEYMKMWRNSEAGKKYLETYRERLYELQKKYNQSTKGKIVQRRKVKRMWQKYPEKFKAREKLRYAVRIGKLKKQPCEVCGLKEVSAHHSDYSLPLKVNWFCRLHHQEIHNNKS